MMINNKIDLNKLAELIGSANKVDLSHTIEEGMPVYPTHPQYFHMKWHTGDPANLYQFLISEHAGTHMDSPAHFYSNDKEKKYLSVEQLPVEVFFSKALKLDFTGIQDDYELGQRDIEDWEKDHFPIHGKSTIVFNFGWDKKWKPLSENNDFTKYWPGINTSCAKYLANKGIKMIGTDCLGIDGSATKDLGSHYELLKNEIVILENLINLDLLPEEFYLFAFPLKIKEGTGSPSRIIGLY